MAESETEETYVVPEGHYFMMGDNRNSSLDSRYWKNTYVAKDKILAKVIFRYYDGFNGKLILAWFIKQLYAINFKNYIRMKKYAFNCWIITFDLHIFLLLRPY